MQHSVFCNIPKEPYRKSSSRRFYVQLYHMTTKRISRSFSLVAKHLLGKDQIFPLTLVLRGISTMGNCELSHISHKELYENSLWAQQGKLRIV